MLIDVLQILFAFSSPLNPDDVVNHSMSSELSKHGDYVKDIAFTVNDAAALYNKAVEKGAKSVMAPHVLKDDHGSVILATVRTVRP